MVPYFFVWPLGNRNNAHSSEIDENKHSIARMTFELTNKFSKRHIDSLNSHKNDLALSLVGNSLAVRRLHIPGLPVDRPDVKFNSKVR